jgi:hypothetical protein
MKRPDKDKEMTWLEFAKYITDIEKYCDHLEEIIMVLQGGLRFERSNSASKSKIAGVKRGLAALAK